MKKRTFLQKSISLMIALTLAIGMIPESLAGTCRLSITAEAAASLNNPRIVTDSTMNSGQKVTWDCVWFGHYPQTEIVDVASTCGINGEPFAKPEDFETNAALYKTLQNATGWDANDDIIINGQKYRRTKVGFYHSNEDDSIDGYYKGGSEDSIYHYFRFDPIKWRVLNISQEKVYLLADKILDAQAYNEEYTDITWERSTIRSWLNGYNSSMNNVSIDYSRSGFIKQAFNDAELKAISDTYLVNEDNGKYGTEGGNNTTDKIFLLSESEVNNTEAAFRYGFLHDTDDHYYNISRFANSTTYIKAKGLRSSCYPFEPGEKVYGGGQWWLRTPGYWKHYAEYIAGSGHYYAYGNFEEHNYGIRPALNLNLSASQLWSYAGTVNSDDTMNEIAAPGSNYSDNKIIETKPSKTTVPVKVSKITLSGISKKIAAGKKIKLTAKVYPANAANKAIVWKSSNKKIATVNQTGTVTFKKKSGGKSVTITATAKDGSGVRASYKITSMKGVVKKVTLKGKTSVKAGKNLKLKAKVTASKKANKTLTCTSSNSRYATVNKKGVVKTKKAGKGKTVTITAKATDGSGKKAKKKIKIK